MFDLRQWSQTIMYEESSRILAKRYFYPQATLLESLPQQFEDPAFFTSAIFDSDVGCLRTTDLKGDLGRFLVFMPD